MAKKIPPAWEMKIATVLKDNFTMANILSLTNSFGADHDIDIPYIRAPEGMNKQNLAQQNISNFEIAQVIQFISEIVDSETGYYSEQIEQLLQELIGKFPDEASTDDAKAVSRISEKFLDYPGVPDAWNRVQRNLAMRHYRESIDNARLALELFFKFLFDNDKSLENQKSEIGKFLSDQPKEFRDLVISQVRTYEVLQNQQIKHNLPTGLDEAEIRYILNTTYLIMNYMEKKSNDK